MVARVWCSIRFTCVNVRALIEEPDATVRTHLDLLLGTNPFRIQGLSGLEVERS